MSNLQLSLKKQWFDLTKSGVKTEDYREITPYWCARLAFLNGKKCSKKEWAEYLMTSGEIYMKFCSNPNTLINPITFHSFDTTTLTLGYPKSTDSERILKLEHKGIEIRTGNPEWGAEPDKLYFVIKHGSFV